MATDPNLLLSQLNQTDGPPANYMQQSDPYQQGQALAASQMQNPAPAAPSAPGVVEPNPIVVNGNPAPTTVAAPANAMQMPQLTAPNVPDRMNVAPVTDTGNAGGVPAPRKRMSLAEIIGNVADSIAVAGGKTGGYHSTLEHMEDRPLQVQSAKLDNTAKQADIDQTQGVVQDQRNVRLHNFAQALQTVRDQATAAGQDGQAAMAKAAQSLGPSMGIDPAVGQKLVDGNHVDGLVAYGNKIGVSGGYGKTPITVTDDDGTSHIAFAGPDAKLHFADGYDGQNGIHMAEGIKIDDTGAQHVIRGAKTGNILSTEAVSGKPEAGVQATGIDSKTGLTTYARPDAGSLASLKRADLAAATGQKQATTAKTVQATEAAGEKLAAGKATALSHVTDARDSLAQVYKDMNALATDKNLQYAVGPVSGRYPDPRGEQVRAQIKALAGEGMAAASAKMKAAMAGGATNIRTQREFDALTAALVGDIQNTHQSPEQYAATLRNRMAPIKTLVAGLNANAARLSASSAGKPPPGWGVASVVGK